MGEKILGLLYVSLHHQLKKKVGVNNIIDKKKFFEILGKHYLVPKNLRFVVVKEMEKRCLVKMESKNNIIVLNCDFDLERDVSKFQRLNGLYN